MPVSVNRPPFREVKLTSPRQENATVAWLQELMIRRSPKYVRGLEVDGVFGRETAEELAAFLYRMGAPRGIGAIGPADQAILWRWDAPNGSLPSDWKVRRIARMAVPYKVASGWSERSWKLAHPGAFPTDYSGRPALAVSMGWASNGYRESGGNNRVPPLVKLGQQLGAKPTFYQMGYAWCAYAFFLAHLKAGSKVARNGLVDGGFWPLYTPYLEDYARRGAFGMKAVPLSQAEPGDGVLFNFDADREVEHIGMFVRQAPGQVTTSDGNTSPTSAANGGMCAVATRPSGLVSTVFRVTS